MMKFLDSLKERWSSEVKLSRAELGDLYIQSSSGHHMVLDDGKIEETGSSTASGVGARLMVDGKTLYSSRNGTDGPAIAGVMEDLSNLGGWAFSHTPDGGDIILPPNIPVPSLGDRLKAIDNGLRKKSSRVSQVEMAVSTSEKSIMILKDDGRLFRDIRRYSMYNVNVVVQHRGETQTGMKVSACRGSMEELLASVDLEALADQALGTAELMLSAMECPAATMPVIMAGEAGGTMIHEACGHGMEADIVDREFSVYRDMIGKMVASPSVTIVDDGSMPGLYGSYDIDDEGTPSQRTVLVEKGMLKGYLTDREMALRLGLPLTGNGRRASYRVPPQPRMSNTFVEPGDGSLEDFISSVGHGLLVRQMGGGEVNPTSGDFVFHVTEGYLIKGTSLLPVRGAVLTGNGPDALKKIKGVGTSIKFVPGLCGKGGQSVPVTDGQPALLVDGITVGGSSTEI